ncbi:DUF1349 domain-containing protein [Candidatus Sumerlaeota bacterium]|nr:DUF1349 domain-containing protein [Candidatus Sumerlaeota bacterium]
MSANAASAQWQSTDIGEVKVPGSFQQNDNTFIVKGSGHNIWNKEDEFQFVYREENGDISISARIVSLQNTHKWAKAGLMLRESLNPDAKFINCNLSPQGVCFHKRTAVRANAENASESIVIEMTPPCWIQLSRSGDTFTAYHSLDGSQWIKIDSVDLDMDDKLYAGLIVCSHNDDVICEAQFDNVSLAKDWNVEYTGSQRQPPQEHAEVKLDAANQSAINEPKSGALIAPNPFSSSKRLMLFYRPDDPKCDVFTLELENARISDKFPELNIEWIDVKQNPKLMKQHDILIVPTAIVCMNDGSNEKFVCYGAKGDDFIKWLSKHFIPAEE